AFGATATDVILSALGAAMDAYAARTGVDVAEKNLLLQVPANRIGHQVLTVGQLKITQEVITLLVFVPFSLFYLKEKLTWDYLWAGLCLLGAVFFLFRGKLMG
ncbi:MAG: DMT family protein, partial [Alloalcanivorax venustensis]